MIHFSPNFKVVNKMLQRVHKSFYVFMVIVQGYITCKELTSAFIMVKVIKEWVLKQHPEEHQTLVLTEKMF